MRHRRKLVVAIIVGAAVVLTLLDLLMSHHVALWWLFCLTAEPRELPQKLISPCFEEIAGHPLPQKARDVKALFIGARDPAIFVRFRTDPEGIKYVVKVFCTHGAKPEAISSDYLDGMMENGISLFIVPSQWEERLGIRLFGREAIETGRLIKGRGHTIFIGDETNTIYIHAFRL